MDKLGKAVDLAAAVAPPLPSVGRAQKDAEAQTEDAADDAGGPARADAESQTQAFTDDAGGPVPADAEARTQPPAAEVEPEEWAGARRLLVEFPARLLKSEALRRRPRAQEGAASAVVEEFCRNFKLARFLAAPGAAGRPLAQGLQAHLFSAALLCEPSRQRALVQHFATAAGPRLGAGDWDRHVAGWLLWKYRAWLNEAAAPGPAGPGAGPSAQADEELRERREAGGVLRAELDRMRAALPVVGAAEEPQFSGVPVGVPAIEDMQKVADRLLDQITEVLVLQWPALSEDVN